MYLIQPTQHVDARCGWIVPAVEKLGVVSEVHLRLTQKKIIISRFLSTTNLQSHYLSYGNWHSHLIIASSVSLTLK